MNRTDYEQQVLEGLRKLLLGSERRSDSNEARLERTFVVEEVSLDTSSTDIGMIVILYRDRRRPECLLGYQMEAVEPTGSANILPIEPELWITILWANFLEHIEGTPYGLPEDCSPDDINWTN